MMLQRVVPLFFFFGLISASSVAAAPAAIVDAVQLPATLVRNAREQPLAPGMEVRHGDQISTGAGARVYLRLAEGSVVKMGESATFDFYATSTRPETFFRGALNVVKGAFRFTTGALAKLRGRDVQIRVGTATIGIRGTDVWGRSNAEKDLVCLIEGHVDVRHPALAEPADLAEPLSFFVAPKGVAPQAVGHVDPAQLAQWALETEIAGDRPVLRAGGKGALVLGVSTGEREALDRFDAARSAGYPARIQPVSGADGWNYRVILSGFESAEAARRSAPVIAAALGMDVQPLR